MDFTREPIIQTVITPKEGCKLVVRSSKSAGQEEYFVDSLEVVAFGNALFFRTLERPKAFLVPATDYEVLEVREARMVLKNVGIDRTIKIGGGKAPKEQPSERPEPSPQEGAAVSAEGASEGKAEGRGDKKRDKRRHGRRRRGQGPEEGEGAMPEEAAAAGAAVTEEKKAEGATTPPPPPVILPPPSTLISETIARYKDNALFKGAFYAKEEDALEQTPSPDKLSSTETQHSDDILEALAMQDVSLEPSEYGSLGLTEEEKETSWQLPFPEDEEKPKEP